MNDDRLKISGDPGENSPVVFTNVYNLEQAQQWLMAQYRRAAKQAADESAGTETVVSPRVPQLVATGRVFNTTKMLGYKNKPARGRIKPRVHVRWKAVHEAIQDGHISIVQRAFDQRFGFEVVATIPGLPVLMKGDQLLRGNAVGLLSAGPATVRAAMDRAGRASRPFVRWQLPLAGRKSNHLTPAQLEEMYNTDAELWVYFIQGAPAFLNTKINNDRAVSNGSSAIFYSLTLGVPPPPQVGLAAAAAAANNDDDNTDNNLGAAGLDSQPLGFGGSQQQQQHQHVNADLQIDQHALATAAAGATVTLRLPPLTVNVLLVDRTVAEFPNISLYPDLPVIPVAASTKELKVFIPGRGSFPISVSAHGVESGIATTFHKAQGRTIPKVLACADQPPTAPYHSYSAFFVFLSRTTLGRNCKVLPLAPGKSFAHLAKLKPVPNVSAFLSGFSTAPGPQTWHPAASYAFLNQPILPTDAGAAAAGRGSDGAGRGVFTAGRSGRGGGATATAAAVAAATAGRGRGPGRGRGQPSA
jgi:hypothetical protein